MHSGSESAAMLSFGIAAVLWSVAFANPLTPHRCASISEDGARLACYDAAFGPPPSGRSKASELSAAPKNLSAGSGREFGFTPAQREAATGAPQTADADSIKVSVQALRHRPTGEFIATFDNGQTWVQREVNPRAVLEVGDSVTIRKAALGSYLLVTPNRIATRVRRLQ